jgi:hypothetical protein
MKNADFQIVLIKRSELGTDRYDTFVMVGGVPLGLFRKVELDFTTDDGLPILKMERVLYGRDTIKVMTQEDAEKEFSIPPIKEVKP